MKNILIILTLLISNYTLAQKVVEHINLYTSNDYVLVDNMYDDNIPAISHPGVYIVYIYKTTYTNNEVLLTLEIQYPDTLEVFPAMLVYSISTSKEGKNTITKYLAEGIAGQTGYYSIITLITDKTNNLKEAKFHFIGYEERWTIINLEQYKK